MPLRGPWDIKGEILDKKLMIEIDVFVKLLKNSSFYLQTIQHR